MSSSAAKVGHQRLSLLQTMREQLHWLRGFADEKMEAEYAEWLRIERAVARMGLMLVPLVALLLAPFYGRYLLNGSGEQDHERLLWLRLIELGLCVPACLLTLHQLRRAPQRPRTTKLLLGTGMLLFAGMAAIRWITEADGGDLPAELVMLVPMVLASVAGLRNHLMLPMIVVCTLFYSIAEIYLHDGPPLARALLGIGIAGSLSLLSALVTNRTARRAWLDRGIAELSAMLDGVTRLPNRSWFNQDVAALMRLLQRKPLPIAVFLLDLDFFKKLNDRHGHAAGDAALASVAEMLLREYSRRPLDLVARYGGEEFVMVLYDVTRDAAAAVGARVVQAVHEMRIPNKDTKEGRLTTSVGIWQGMPDKTTRIEDLLSIADKALYAAKGNGRNQFELRAG